MVSHSGRVGATGHPRECGAGWGCRAPKPGVAGTEHGMGGAARGLCAGVVGVGGGGHRCGVSMKSLPQEERLSPSFLKKLPRKTFWADGS